MSTLQVTSLTSNNTIRANTVNVGDVAINSTTIAVTSNVVINASAISIGNSTVNSVFSSNSSIPSIVLSGQQVELITEAVNTQIFTANGTWTKPTWANTGSELILVQMWGGGGGGRNAINGFGGGGGAFAFGYYLSSQCNSVCNVVVGTGGTPNTAGTNSIFYANTSTTVLVACGGGEGNTLVGGGGGGWSGLGTLQLGGSPIGGNVTVKDSTFGGGAGANVTANAGVSIYGGGGGGRTTQLGGNSVSGGGGGVNDGIATFSIYGGRGGNSTFIPTPPGGGGSGGSSGNTSTKTGARGEVRIYTIRKVS